MPAGALSQVSTAPELPVSPSTLKDPLSPGEILAVAREIRNQTSRSFALNLWVAPAAICGAEPAGQAMSWDDFERGLTWIQPYCQELQVELPQPPPGLQADTAVEVTYDFEDQIQAVLEAQPPVFSFVYGIPPNQVLQECRRRHIVTVGAATTEAEAVALEEAGVDAIVATGFEAGGHRVSFLRRAEECLTGTLALIPRVVDRVSRPVAAAGGIADGRGIVAALALGASAAQIGTAFLACQESAAPEIHRQQLFGPQAGDTVLTRVFTGRLARGLRNRLTQQLEGRQLPYPLQSFFTGYLKKAAIQQGRWDLMSLWAGQAAPILRHHDASSLLSNLIQQVETTLEHLSKR